MPRRARVDQSGAGGHDPRSRSLRRLIAGLALVVAAPAAAIPPAPPPPPEAETPAVRQAIRAANDCFTQRWEAAGQARVAAQDALKSADGPPGSPGWLKAQGAVLSLVRSRIALAACEDQLRVEQATPVDLQALRYWRDFIAGNMRSQAPYELSILRALAGYRDDLAW